jgi:hypothetical protein
VTKKFLATLPFLVISLCLSVSGQSVVGGQANPAGPFTASLERRQAEQELRGLPQRLREKREHNFTDPKVLKQMNEDFLKLQTVRAEMVKSFVAGTTIPPPSLRRSSDELKRRATRLRSMLALSEESEKVELPTERSPTIESVNDRAYQLCIEISRFTENPMFRSNGVITARQVTEAAKSLDTVISLADALERESERIL